MSSTVKINGSKVNSAKKDAQRIYDALDLTYDKAIELRDLARSSSWSGEQRVYFEMYLDIILQLHKDMRDLAKEQLDALSFLEESEATFLANDISSGVRNV